MTLFSRQVPSTTWTMASAMPRFGGKVGIDCTAKMPEEEGAPGNGRPTCVMSPEVKELVKPSMGQPRILLISGSISHATMQVANAIRSPVRQAAPFTCGWCAILGIAVRAALLLQWGLIAGVGGFRRSGWPGWSTFIWITVALTGVRTLGMSANRFIHRKEDAANPRTRGRTCQGLVTPLDVIGLAVVGTGVSSTQVAAQTP